jgi:hypothetical protein
MEREQRGTINSKKINKINRGETYRQKIQERLRRGQETNEIERRDRQRR